MESKCISSSFTSKSISNIPCDTSKCFIELSSCLDEYRRQAADDPSLYLLNWEKYLLLARCTRHFQAQSFLIFGHTDSVPFHLSQNSVTPIKLSNIRDQRSRLVSWRAHHRRKCDCRMSSLVDGVGRSSTLLWPQLTTPTPSSQQNPFYAKSQPRLMKKGTTLTSWWNKNSDSSSTISCPEEKKDNYNNRCVSNGKSDVIVSNSHKKTFLNSPKKPKMPAFLRLDSAGEDASSSYMITEHANPSVSLIKSGAPHSLEQSDSCRSNSKYSKSLLNRAHFSWSPSSMAATTRSSKLFAPNYHSTPNFMKSTPNFMKSKSFPEVTHAQTADKLVAFGGFSGRRDFSNSANLFWRSSVPIPNSTNCLSVMSEKHTLRESSSTPSLLVQSCDSSDSNLFKVSGYLSDMESEVTNPSRMPQGILSCNELGDESEKSDKKGVLFSHVPSSSSPLRVPQKENSQKEMKRTDTSEKTKHEVTKNNASSPGMLNNCDIEVDGKNENSFCSFEKENKDSDSSKTASRSSTEESQDSNRSFVLFRERKCTKKGRPSTKKQKKRKREKRRQSEASNESSVLFSLGSRIVGGNSQEKKLHMSICDDSINFAHSLPDQTSTQSKDHDTESDISFISAHEVSNTATSQVPNSTPIKSGHSSSHACILNFISGFETDSENDSEDNSENSESDSDDSWCNDEMNNSVGISGSKGLGLSIDAIFKQKELPSLKSVMQDSRRDSTSGFSARSPSRFTVYVGSPCNSSLEDSIQFSSVPESDSQDIPSSPLAQSVLDKLNGFSQGLCLDSIFSCVVPATAHTSSKSATTVLDSQQLDNEIDLQEVNAKWDKHYQTAGFRSCCSTSPINNPAVKVFFVDDSHLVTVYEVGTEERRGIWQNFALDRERFNRRILEVGELLSPVLDKDHREKIFNRNIHLTEARQQD